MDPTFARTERGEFISIVDRIIDLLDKVPVEGVPSTVAQTMLIEEYETFYGIYNHDNPEASPSGKLLMPLVGRHIREDYQSFNSLTDRIEQFVELNIHNATGLSLTEFLEMPRHLSKAVRVICENKLKRENTAGDAFQRQLNQMKG